MELDVLLKFECDLINKGVTNPIERDK